MVNDPLGDMLTQIRNAALSGKRLVKLPFSRIKHQVARILEKEGYIESVSESGESCHKTLNIAMRYIDKKPVVTGLTRKSKPGLRVYVDKDSIPVVVGGMGISVLSTSKGIMTGKEAKIKGVGGEVLCIVW